MSNQPAITKITLDDAITRMVSVLTKKNFSFSAHDVTALLREAVNTDALKLNGLPADFQIQIGPITKMTTEVDHSQVKAKVHDLYEADQLPGYTRQKKNSSRTGRDYWEYSPDQNAVQPPQNLQALAN